MNFDCLFRHCEALLGLFCLKFRWSSPIPYPHWPYGPASFYTFFTRQSSTTDVVANNIQTEALPADLLHETLQTFALLLPRANGECKTWFERAYKKVESRHSDAIDPKAADIAVGSKDRAQWKFEFWHERLRIIPKAYDESEPSTLSQRWNDRRKKVQWYTFWVAILILFLTIVFGMVQAVTGILQVYAAFHFAQLN